MPEVFTTAHDALFTQAGLQARRAPARPRRRRRRRHGGDPARPRAGRARDRDRAQPRAARRRSPRSAPTVIAPEGFAEHGPFDVILELVGAPNLPDNLNALNTGGPDRGDRDRRRRQGRAQPRGADGQARPDPRLDAARPSARGEGADRPGAWSARCCRCSRPGTSTVPIAATYPLDRGRGGLRRVSRPAASSARSSC